MTGRKSNFIAANSQEMARRNEKNLSPPGLRELTNGMIDTMLNLIADCVDADVVFTPVVQQAKTNNPQRRQCRVAA